MAEKTQTGSLRRLLNRTVIDRTVLNVLFRPIIPTRKAAHHTRNCRAETENKPNYEGFGYAKKYFDRVGQNLREAFLNAIPFNYLK